MLVLSERQLSWVKMKLDAAEKGYAGALKKLTDAASNPGQTANELGWYGIDLAYQDLLRRELGQMIRFTTDPECKATVENMLEWYTKEVLCFQPERSTNQLSNLISTEKHRAYQEMREMLQVIEGR